MTRILALALVLALAPIASARGDGWRPVAAAPIAPSGYLAGAWTGEELVVFGRTRVGGRSRNVAAAYTPRTGRWRRLAPPAGPAGSHERPLSPAWARGGGAPLGGVGYWAEKPPAQPGAGFPPRPRRRVPPPGR